MVEIYHILLVNTKDLWLNRKQKGVQNRCETAEMKCESLKNKYSGWRGNCILSPCLCPEFKTRRDNFRITRMNTESV